MFHLYLGTTATEASLNALRQELTLNVFRYGGSCRYLSRKACKLERWAYELGYLKWSFRLKKAEEAKEFIRYNRKRFVGLTPTTTYDPDFVTHIDLYRV